MKRLSSVSLALLIIVLCMPTDRKLFAQSSKFRYVAVGDSYTIGTGVSSKQAWPTLLTDHLRFQGVDIALLANLGQAGWTSAQVLTHQVPQLVSLQPNFVTVLVGANDVFQGVDPSEFTQRLKTLLDSLQKILPSQNQILVLTIPDFSVTLKARNFGSSFAIHKTISDFNTIITKEAQSRGLKVVDLFKVSQEMDKKPQLVAADGLHPSPKGHLIWEETIYPTVKELLK